MSSFKAPKHVSTAQKYLYNYNLYGSFNTEISSFFSPRRSNAELVGDGHDHFEDGHEGGDLAEVAAADDLGVDGQGVLVVAALDAAADLVQASEDAGRQLEREERQQTLALC